MPRLYRSEKYIPYRRRLCIGNSDLSQCRVVRFAGCKPLGLSVGLEGQGVRAVHTGLLRADCWASVTWPGEALNRLEHISVLRKSRGWTKVRDLQRLARLSMLFVAESLL